MEVSKLIKAEMLVEIEAVAVTVRPGNA